jgi:hypothetical protein
MTNKKILWVMLGIVLAFSFVATACSAPAKSAGGTLVGTWNGTLRDSNNDGRENAAVFVFNSDGTGTCSIDEFGSKEEQTFKYVASAENIFILIGEGTSTYSPLRVENIVYHYFLSSDGKTLILYYTFDLNGDHGAFWFEKATN